MKLSGDRNQCQGCRRYFNSSHAFDKHRDGDHKGNGRYCLEVDLMMEKGMVQGADGFWRGSVMPAGVLEQVAA